MGQQRIYALCIGIGPSPARWRRLGLFKQPLRKAIPLGGFAPWREIFIREPTGCAEPNACRLKIIDRLGALGSDTQAVGVQERPLPRKVLAKLYFIDQITGG